MTDNANQAQPDEYDAPWKVILKGYFKDFLAFFLPQAHAEIDWRRPAEFLDQEFSRLVPSSESKDRRVDLLAKVWLLDGSERWVLIHVEVHGNRTAEFEERMLTVQYRVRDLYHRPVVALVILADEETHWRPSEYRDEMWGTQLSYRFTSVKLLDYLNRLPELEESDNPFAIVTLAHLRAKQTKRQPQTRYAQRWQITRSLYRRSYSREQVYNFCRFIEWVMALPDDMERQILEELKVFEEENEMSYMLSAERFGMEKGVLIGEQKGEANVLLRLLQRRFGQVPDPVKAKVTDAKLESLEAWTDRILDAKTLDDVFAN
ncbi:MAG: DUF4351 domain-containing protein [Magnetococcales bacterium]|nr:DUF4351 domain-containing protein [Magnetococcales bacterium]MBF0116815.1 DUF4351 domain-containing protein [Magnetococcales bacterium]